MIRVTKFDGTKIVLNADWILSVETTPDTLITLTTGNKLLVRDRLEDVVTAFKAYKREVGHSIFPVTESTTEEKPWS